MILPVRTTNSPYTKTIATQRGAHSPYGAVRGATPSKAKGVSRSPSQKPSCASAPARTTGRAGERLPTTHPPRRAKRGTNTLKLGVAREWRSAPITQPHPQRQSSHMLVPVTGERRSAPITQPHPQRQSSHVLVPGTGERRSSPITQPHPQRQSNHVLVPGTGERRSSPITQPHPQRQSSHVLVPVRVKKAGLKLVDPARVRSLTAGGAAPPDSGEDGQQSDHQARGSQQRSLDGTHTTISRSAGSWVPHLRNRTGVPDRRQAKHTPVRQRTSSVEESEGHLLTQQMEGLALGDGECPECSPSHNCQELNKPLASPQATTDHSDIRTSEEMTQVDANSVGEPNLDDQHTPSQGIMAFHPTSAIKEEIAVDLSNNEDLSSKSAPTKVIQEQALEEGDRGPQTEPCTFMKEDQDTKEHGLELECKGVTPSTEDASNKQQVTVNTKTQSQENISSHGGLQRSPSRDYVGYMEENCVLVPLEEDNPLQRINMDLIQSSNLAETGPSNGLEGTNPLYSSRRNGFIRQSEGVLVLTRSTDENAVFIPKLKFEFTPENSIDWATLPQQFLNNQGVQAKGNDLRFTKICTPRGPSFSKSLLKKSASINGPPAGDASHSAQGSPIAGEFTKLGSPPLYGIVDLSISFQGKYRGEKVPTDIPKILLTEEDNNED